MLKFAVLNNGHHYQTEKSQLCCYFSMIVFPIRVLLFVNKREGRRKTNGHLKQKCSFQINFPKQNVICSSDFLSLIKSQRWNIGKHQHICSLNQRGILKIFLCWTLGAAEHVPAMALSTVLHVPTWHIPSSYQCQFCHFYMFRLLITQIIYKAITASLLWNTAFYSSFSIQKWNSAKNPSKKPQYRLK